MRWEVPKIWENGDVWIIGGGPSIIQTFKIPDDLVENVVSGKFSISEYSPYFSPIYNKHVIGVNIAFLLGDWLDMAFFGDSDFFLKWKPKLEKSKSLMVSCAPNTAKFDWVKYLERDGNKPKGITELPNKVSWNANSGAAAINVAVHAGAKRIFLLGFDMKLADDYKQHYHGEYLGEKRQIRSDRKNLPFHKHLPGFAQIKFDADALGVMIYNVNIDSAIKEFPKVTLDIALKIGK